VLESLKFERVAINLQYFQPVCTLVQSTKIMHKCNIKENANMYSNNNPFKGL